ncbi:hypothetical protein AWN88_14360 [Agrobacterium tumefaciens]|nr:hypothetical protein AWN88_14360 [Agrobacterium tumefaciens]ANV23134.1 hypothetical protein BA939_03795 [Rhizobium sp. S41]AUC09952.1 hypothetical protein BLX90_06945 [Rhizobium sp. Y9]KGE81318.1 hypothetical protein LW14_18060 [Rhizobium sp. H41]OAI87084.1 hypothetical protein AYO27_09895 [Rhizobium sp. GHKF11]OOO22760.1 hypothetical protein BTE56_04975 [Agrobacterium pusense]PZU79063.1 MAG: hypothetical protein DI546_01800 [Rhizobium sp.]QSZ57065.1 hypothetical protein BTN45_08090 [Rhiz
MSFSNLAGAKVRWLVNVSRRKAALFIFGQIAPSRQPGQSLYPCRCGMALFTHPGKRKIANPQFFAAFYAA